MPPEAQMRNKLPRRRQLENFDVKYRTPTGDLREFILSIGFGEDRRPAEVFIQAAKTGQELDALMDDVCILISLCLQHGHAATSLLRTMGEQSMAAAIVAKICSIDEEILAGVR